MGPVVSSFPLAAAGPWLETATCRASKTARLRYSPQVAKYSRGATDTVCETAVKRLDLALETAASPLVPFPPPGKDATSVAGAAGGVKLNGLWAALAHAAGSATTVASGALGATRRKPRVCGPLW
jgi:hypothetical protein